MFAKSIITFVLLAIISTSYPGAISAAESIQGTPADAVLAVIAKTTWIAEGKSKQIIYIFFDPNCAGCHFLYKSLRPFIRSQQVQVRWIPVAVVNATSLGKAAAILQATSPMDALSMNEKRYRPENGGIDEAIAEPHTEASIHANTRLLMQLPIPVIPTMLFADAQGRAVLIQGALTPIALRKVFRLLP